MSAAKRARLDLGWFSGSAGCRRARQMSTGVRRSGRMMMQEPVSASTGPVYAASPAVLARWMTSASTASSAASGFASDGPFLDHRDQRVDLHRASAFQILQHRGLVRTDLARALDPPLDVDPEFDTEFLGNGLALQHDRLRQSARCRIRANHVER